MARMTFRSGLWTSGGVLLAGPAVALAALYAELSAPVVAGVTCVSFLAGVGVFLLAWRPLAASLREETEVARRIAAGEYKATLAAAGSPPDHRQALSEMLARLKRDLGLAQGIVKSMVTPFAVTDENEVFIGGNPALIDMVQHTGRPEDHYGQNVGQFFYGDARPTVLGVAMRERQPIRKEVEFTGRKGRKLNIHIDASPLYDLDGRLMGALCVYTDLTELRRNEARILEQSGRIAAAVKEIEAISRELFETADGLSREVGRANTTTCSQLERTLSAAKSMDEINSAALDIARNASQASSQAEQTQAKARDGAAVVKQAEAAIAETERLAGELKVNLDRLGAQAESIGRILDVISDIADQTNLLALNAAIEAARAGDAGRGFAVVADEVRKLAEKTMTATKEVGDSISGIQRDTRLNVAGMDRAAAAVGRASALAASSGQALGEIVSLVAKTSGQIQAIAAASEQQSTATEGISEVMDMVRTSCDETSNGMGQAAKAVERLTELARDLRDSVQKTLE